jgi:hypothetical protein
MKIPPIFSTVILLLLSNALHSQVAINTSGAQADASAILDVNSTDKGLLVPRVSLVSLSNDVSPVINPADGLLVYNTEGNNLNPGFYVWNGDKWASLATMDQVQSVLHGPASAGVYGEIYDYKAIGSYAEISIPSSGTYINWNSGIQGDLSNMIYSNGSLIIQNPGMYSVSFTAVQQLSSGGKIVDAALFVNDVRQDDMHGRAWFKEGGKSQDISFSGIINLEENDIVRVGFTMNDNGAIRLEMANLNLTRLN